MLITTAAIIGTVKILGLISYLILFSYQNNKPRSKADNESYQSPHYRLLDFIVKAGAHFFCFSCLGLFQYGLLHLGQITGYFFPVSYLERPK